MDTIEGVEWVVVAIFLVAFLVGIYLVVSVQGDLRVEEEIGDNGDDQAADMFVALIGQTCRRIDIHDDGNDSTASVYNNDQVMDAIRDRIRQRRIEVRCLFNDEDQPLKLLGLARSEECRGHIRVWYAKGDRPDQDIHYKVVDKGNLVHLSLHAHGASERSFVLRKAPWWWARATRRRISKSYLDHFMHGLRDAVEATAELDEDPERAIA